MKTNKFLSILLTLAVCMALAVSAAAQTGTAAAPLTYTLETSAPTVKPEESVTVTVGIAENIGFYHTVVGLTYDPELFVLEGDNPEIPAGITVEMNTAAYGDKIAVDTTTPGLITVTVGGDPYTVYGNAQAPKFGANGMLVKVTFTVKDTVDAEISNLFALSAEASDLLVDNMKVGVGNEEGAYAAQVAVEYIQNTNILLETHDCSSYDAKILAAVKPDCTNTGLTEGSVCSYCGKVLVPQEELPALEHIGGKATCDDQAICDRCHKPYGQRLEHTWFWVTDKEPTYTTPGQKHEMCINVGCDATRNERTPIPVKTCEHNLTKTEAVETSCAADGMREYWTCSVCKRLYSDEAGILEATLEELKIPALPHEEEIIPGKEAGCLTPGLTEGKHCTVCDRDTVPQVEIPALNHDLETIPGVPATCTTPGLTDGKKCMRCGEVTVPREVIPAGVHREETVPGVPATCTTPGLSDGKKCSVCGEVLQQQEETPITAHRYGVWETVKEATEEEEGLEKHNCVDCGREETRSLPKLQPKKTISAPVLIALSVTAVALIALVVTFVVYKKR